MGEITLERNSAGSRRKGWVLYIAVSVGMSALFLTMPYVQNVILQMAILFGAIYLAVAASIFKSRYTFNDEGIKEELRPYLRFSIVRPKSKFFPWSAVKSFKLDHELNRVHGDRWFLRINFHNTRYRMWIFEGTNQYEWDEFARMRDFFLAHVEVVDEA